MLRKRQTKYYKANILKIYEINPFKFVNKEKSIWGFFKPTSAMHTNCLPKQFVFLVEYNTEWPKPS